VSLNYPDEAKAFLLNRDNCSLFNKLQSASFVIFLKGWEYHCPFSIDLKVNMAGAKKAAAAQRHSFIKALIKEHHCREVT
jgi:hypothetical protein